MDSHDTSSVTLTPSDLKHPLIKTWLVQREREAAHKTMLAAKAASTHKILAYAGNLLGCEFTNIHGLATHLKPSPSRATALTDDQQSKLRDLAKARLPMRAIALQVGCTFWQVKAFYRAHAELNRKPLHAVRLTSAQRDQIKTLAQTSRSVASIAIEVGCTFEQARPLVRQLRSGS